MTDKCFPCKQTQGNTSWVRREQNARGGGMMERCGTARWEMRRVICLFGTLVFSQPGRDRSSEQSSRPRAQIGWETTDRCAPTAHDTSRAHKTHNLWAHRSSPHNTPSVVSKPLEKITRGSHGSCGVSGGAGLSLSPVFCRLADRLRVPCFSAPAVHRHTSRWVCVII